MNRKPPILTPADMERIAICVHEAGHAVAGVVLGGKVKNSVVHQIADNHGRLGLTEFSFIPEAAEPLAAYAGPYAETRWRNHNTRPGIREIAAVMGNSGQLDHRSICVASALGQTGAVVPLMERCWPAVRKVAENLFYGSIGHRDVCAALGLSHDPRGAAFQLSLIQSG